jgi:HD-like signal output (HDOD) protein
MRQLPPTARVLSRLQKLLADANSGLDDVATLLRLDASLTTRVIQISNSVYFGRGNPCRTIEDAVNRVGFREIYRLVAIVASGAIVAGPLPAYTLSNEQVWDDSVACGLASELIADSLGEDASVAYTIGLLRAVGRQPINQYVQHVNASRVFTHDGFPLEHSGSEFAALGFSQANVAASMLEKWDFARAIIEPIRKQYEPLEASEDHDRMACILFSARLLTANLLNREEPQVAQNEDEILGHLRLARGDILALLPVLEGEFTRASQIAKT